MTVVVEFKVIVTVTTSPATRFAPENVKVPCGAVTGRVIVTSTTSPGTGLAPDRVKMPRGGIVTGINKWLESMAPTTMCISAGAAYCPSARPRSARVIPPGTSTLIVYEPTWLGVTPLKVMGMSKPCKIDAIVVATPLAPLPGMLVWIGGRYSRRRTNW